MSGRRRFLGSAGSPDLPTYQAVADVLEKKNGSGMRLAGWTLARTVMITPPLLVVGIPWRKAIVGGLLASGLISLFTLLRIRAAKAEADEAAIRAAQQTQP